LNWEKEKRNLLKAPARWHYRQALKEFFEVKIVGKWQCDGIAPWQCYLPVKFQGVNYTLYIRERHEDLSLKVMWGHEGTCKPQPKYHGFLGFVNLLGEDEFKRLDSGEDLYKLSEEVGIQYIKELKGILPKCNEELDKIR